MMRSHSPANVSPAAAAAIGNRDVSVMPGETFTSRIQGIPPASTIVVEVERLTTPAH